MYQSHQLRLNFEFSAKATNSKYCKQQYCGYVRASAGSDENYSSLKRFNVSIAELQAKYTTLSRFI